MLLHVAAHNLPADIGWCARCRAFAESVGLGGIVHEIAQTGIVGAEEQLVVEEPCPHLFHVLLHPGQLVASVAQQYGVGHVGHGLFKEIEGFALRDGAVEQCGLTLGPLLVDVGDGSHAVGSYVFARAEAENVVGHTEIAIALHVAHGIHVDGHRQLVLIAQYAVVVVVVVGCDQGIEAVVFLHFGTQLSGALQGLAQLLFHVVEVVVDTVADTVDVAHHRVVDKVKQVGHIGGVVGVEID